MCCLLLLCDAQLMDKSEYQKLKAEVEEFNAKNKYRKRGIAAIPTKYVLSIFLYFGLFLVSAI